MRKMFNRIRLNYIFIFMLLLISEATASKSKIIGKVKCQNDCKNIQDGVITLKIIDSRANDLEFSSKIKNNGNYTLKYSSEYSNAKITIISSNHSPLWEWIKLDSTKIEKDYVMKDILSSAPIVDKEQYISEAKDSIEYEYKIFYMIDSVYASQAKVNLKNSSGEILLSRPAGPITPNTLFKGKKVILKKDFTPKPIHWHSYPNGVDTYTLEMDLWGENSSMESEWIQNFSGFVLADVNEKWLRQRKLERTRLLEEQGEAKKQELEIKRVAEMEAKKDAENKAAAEKDAENKAAAEKAKRDAKLEAKKAEKLAVKKA